MASAIWGWRLEALLGTVLFFLIKVGFLLGPGGPLLLIGLLGIAVWQIPRLRRQLTTRLHQSRARRLVAKALRECVVVGYDAKTQHLQVNFKSGETYDYFNVPPPAHQELMFAKSKGKFLDDVIRPRFRHVRHPRP